MASITLSGTVYTDEGVTAMGAGRTINVSVNGAASAASATTAADGTFTTGSFTSISGDVLTAYLQGNAEVGVTVTKSTGANVTGVSVYQNGLNVRSDGGTLSNANVNTSDNNGATGITGVYSCPSTAALTLAAGVSLYVQSGQTFGANVTTITVPGSLSVRGTFSGVTVSAFVMTGGSGGTVRTNGNSLPLLTVNASGGTYTLLDALAASSVTLTAGTLDVGASNFQITISNNWSATSGAFTCRQGTVTLNGTNATTHTVSGAAGAFYHLTIQGTAQTRQVTADLTLGGNLTVSTGTLDLNGKNLTLAGNLANSATFTAGAGTVTLNGTAQTLSGSTTFNSLVANTSGDVLTITDGTTQTFSSVTLQNVTVRGSGSAGYTFAMPASGSQTIDHLTLSRCTATGNPGVAGTGSVDGLNNVNWTFPSAGGGLLGRRRRAA